MNELEDYPAGHLVDWPEGLLAYPLGFDCWLGQLHRRHLPGGEARPGCHLHNHLAVRLLPVEDCQPWLGLGSFVDNGVGYFDLDSLGLFWFVQPCKRAFAGAEEACYNPETALSEQCLWIG